MPNSLYYHNLGRPFYSLSGSRELSYRQTTQLSLFLYKKYKYIGGIFTNLL